MMERPQAIPRQPRPKGTTSFRISHLAKGQLVRLARHWGVTRSEALSIIIDRAYRAEMGDNGQAGKEA